MSIVETPVRTEIDAPERGALFLDEHAPGWYDRVVLSRLNLEHPTWCVCGQVFWAEGARRCMSGFTYWMSKFYPTDLDYDPIEFYGFCDEERYGQRWRELILERRAAAAA